MMAGLYIPRPPGSLTSRSTHKYVPIRRRRRRHIDDAGTEESHVERNIRKHLAHRHRIDADTEESRDERHIRKHLAHRYNVHAKWDKLRADKETRSKQVTTVTTRFLPRDAMLAWY